MELIYEQKTILKILISLKNRIGTNRLNINIKLLNRFNVKGGLN